MQVAVVLPASLLATRLCDSSKTNRSLRQIYSESRGISGRATDSHLFETRIKGLSIVPGSLPLRRIFMNNTTSVYTEVDRAQESWFLLPETEGGASKCWKTNSWVVCRPRPMKIKHSLQEVYSLFTTFQKKVICCVILRKYVVINSNENVTQ